MVLMNKFSSILTIDGQKNSLTHGVYHVMSWAPHIAKILLILFVKSIKRWSSAELTNNNTFRQIWEEDASEEKLWYVPNI